MAKPPQSLSADGCDLPRLAVISEVTIEKAGGGGLLLYRLFKSYPSARLRIVTGVHSSGDSAARERLADVVYRDVRYRVPRVVRNRLNPFWPVVMSRLIKRQINAINAALGDFQPEAILTVPHHYLWIAAAQVAKQRGIPLHLIVHDDWPSYQTFRKPGLVSDTVRSMLRAILGRVYRQAATRFVVSPGMGEKCKEWFGPEGTLLYPNRGDDSPEPRLRVRPKSEGPPVVAFCGHVNQDGTIDLLRRLSVVLEELGGRLDLYTIVSDEMLANAGLKPPVVRKVGYFPASELGDRLAETAQALFLPASFEERELLDVATLFPSKLADYTTIGLPVIVWGPPESSAARWVVDFPGTAELITELDPTAVRDAVTRIVSDPVHATSLADQAMEAGTRCFDLSVARETLFSGLAECHARAN